MKYRKKPVEIEAFQWLGRTLADRDEFVKQTGFPKWAIGCVKEKCGMIIPTLEGDHVAEYGDYIIKGVKNEFYPCRPDIFEMTYEKV